jgi:hypothetical protein
MSNSKTAMMLAQAKRRRDSAAAMIETQRGNLGCAISLLQCLAVALEHGEDFHSGPCYYEVAQMGVKMVQKSMSALDSINLPGEKR